MMKILMCFIAVCVLANGTYAQSTTGFVNVLDFGTKGDGVTDDTEAIRKAAKAAAISFSGPSSTHVYYQTGPALVFPSGRYKISDEINVNCLEIRAEGRAVLSQSDKSKSILKNHNVWRTKISNLTFDGGKNQIDLRNVNLDTGQVVIDHCRFYNATGFGLYTDVLSTTVKVNDCEFIFCHQAWYNGRSDQAIMSDCWIETDKNMEDKAVIEHRGVRLTLSNVIGVPLCGKPRQRWIDNHGVLLTATHFRFGGEGGGFTPIYNFTKYLNRSQGNLILVEDSMVAANSSYSANCVVYCAEVPNSIVIRDTQLVGSTPVIVDKKIDLATYFLDVDRDMLTYSVSNCTGESVAKLPGGLVKPTIVKSPAKHILSEKETKAALTAAKKAVLSIKDETFTGGVSNGHAQQVDQGKYVDLTDWSVKGNMDATTESNSSWLALGKAGSDWVAVYRQDQPGAWPHITISAEVDLDKYPWLTWKQKKGTAPGAFCVKVIDVETGDLHALYNETQVAEYDYYAKNLKDELKKGGVRKIEIRFYPLAQGWEYPSAKAGQYTVYDFMRMEAE